MVAHYLACLSLAIHKNNLMKFSDSVLSGGILKKMFLKSIVPAWQVFVRVQMMMFLADYTKAVRC